MRESREQMVKRFAAEIRAREEAERRVEREKWDAWDAKREAEYKAVMAAIHAKNAANRARYDALPTWRKNLPIVAYFGVIALLLIAPIIAVSLSPKCEPAECKSISEVMQDWFGR